MRKFVCGTGVFQFPPDGFHEPTATSSKTVQLLSSGTTAPLFANEDTCVYTILASARARGHFVPRVRIRRLPIEFSRNRLLSVLAFSFRDTRTFLLALEHFESSPFSLVLLFCSDCVDAARFADPETALRPLMTLRARILKRYYLRTSSTDSIPR